eukprot:3089650-Pyramimonas_sp.AAC.1
MRVQPSRGLKTATQLENRARLKLQEASAPRQQRVSKAEQVAEKSIAEKRHLEERVFNAQEMAM